MVEKRGFREVLIIGLIGAVVGLLKLISDLAFIRWSLSQTRSSSSYIAYLLMIVFAFLLVISAIYLIKLKNWARALLIFLLPLFILQDISYYVFSHSTKSLPSFVEMIVFVFSAFGKPSIPLAPNLISNFLIYAYIIFSIFYLTRSAVRSQFE
jgi:hypothetical protein